jgi:small subunit ribosomal protein S6
MIAPMRQYEMTLILVPAIDPADEKKVAAVVKKVLTGNEATIKTQVIQGKKQLAYPIKKITEGVYVRLELSSKALSSGLMQNQVKLTPEVLRFLLISRGA